MTKDELRKLMPDGVVEETLEKIWRAVAESEDGLRREIAEAGEKIRSLAGKADEYDELKQKYEAELLAVEEKTREAQFQAAVDEALREKGCRSVRAAKALLDMETLRANGGAKEEIRRAVEELAASEEGAFLFAADGTGRKVNIGGNGFKATAQGGSMAAIRRAAGLK